MCGIAGVVGGPDTREELERRVAQMSLAVAHRGPDGDGIWSDPHSPVCLAQRRLAIVDLSEAGRQPMTSLSGRWVVVFNGEIYNHRELRDELTSAGISYAGHSDTRALAEAIDRWGFEAALHRSNGMFAIAAWDTQEQRLLLARDRLGEKPLYWSELGGRFSFASELRGVLAGCDERPPIDDRSIASMLHWSFIPHPHTARVGVHQLPPGGLLEVRVAGTTATVEERRWWSLGDVIDLAIDARRPTTLDRAADELHDLLSDSVRLRLEADVPLGAFLSGGVDSSVIAAIAQQQLGGSLKTFTVRMPDGPLNESDAAEAVARHLGSDHVVADMSVEEALALVPKMGLVYDEPFGDPSMLPTTLLCRAAREHLTVCLGGDGGDELFAGYNRHVFGAGIEGVASRLPQWARRAAGSALLLPSPKLVDRMSSGRLVPARWRLPNLGDKLQKAGALVRADDAWESLAGIWPSAALEVEPYEPCVPTVRNPLGTVERMMLIDTACVLPDQMLVKVDRASMHAPIEVRVPMLDHRLLGWAWRQPIEVKTDGRRGKLVLRHLAKRLLPEEVVERPKLGFDPPLAEWFRRDLRPAMDGAVRSAEALNVVDGRTASRVWEDHLRMRRNWEYRLWALMNMEPAS